MTTAYNYVIVGGGTAGLVVAARLTEDPSKSVAVIEAGANRMDDANINVPGLMTKLYDDEKYDWSFLTEPQEALNGRQIACPRGRVLGGSSALNFSAILFPSKADFNDWASLNDDNEWNAEAMVPYLRKFHTFTPPSDATKEQMMVDYIDTESHGTSGPLQVGIPDGFSPVYEAWVKAFKELGFHATTDQIHGKTIGCFSNPVSIHPDTRTREYSAVAYLTENVTRRPNLHVITESLVETIEWAEDAGPLRATSVRVLHKDGTRTSIRLRQGGEVILAAGAIKSPQILELSGIGNEELLKKHNIPVKFANVGVGENLQDHLMATTSYEIADDQVSGDMLQRDTRLAQAAMDTYVATRTGPMAGTPLGTAYLPPVDNNGVLSATELQKLVSDTSKESYPHFQGQARQYELLRARLAAGEPSVEYLFVAKQVNHDAQKLTMEHFFSTKEPGNYVSAIALLNHPFSRGTVHIKSADPAAAPAIDPRYLTHPLDLELQARHAQYFANIVQTDAFQRVLKPNGRKLPSQNASDLKVARQIARDRAFTCFHPAGTCAMMPRELGGVVSNRLLVHGTQNVRVVDASVFPLEPLGNIQATVYAVAEKAADIIKSDAVSVAKAKF